MRTATLARLTLAVALSWASFSSIPLGISEIRSSKIEGGDVTERNEELCQGLNILTSKLLRIPSKDLNGQLSSIMLWLINNPTENSLQRLTNLYHPSPTDPTLQAYKLFIDNLAQFFVNRGESPEQARNRVFKLIADAIRVIYEIYDNDGARARALLELISRTDGFGLIALAQLGQLRGLASSSPSSDPQPHSLRLIDYIIGVNSDNILNDILRYYCRRSAQTERLR